MAKEGGNPQKFVKHRMELAASPLAIRLPVEVDKYVRSLPDKSEWVRNAIMAQMERDLNAQQQDAS
ncbi:hypothetical protein ABN584_03685 [Gloeocapsa sp. BRSZ]